MFISWKSNPSCNLCHFPGADTQMKMMGILVLSLPFSKLLDCGKGKRIRSFLLFSHVLRNLQSQGTGLDTFYFIKRNKASLWQGGICFVILCVREEWPFKHHTIRANMRCYDNSRIEISLLLLYPLCWLSFTSSEYFLIVCSIEHCRSFKPAEPTLRATVYGQGQKLLWTWLPRRTILFLMVIRSLNCHLLRCFVT